MCSLEELPLELLLDIFNRVWRDDLHALGRVSRRIRRAAWDPSLWRPTLIDMPNNVLLKIFEYLPLASVAACSLVCKNTKGVALNPSLWKKIVIFEPLITEEQAENIQNWVYNNTGETPLIAYFPMDLYDSQVKKFVGWKIYPSRMCYAVQCFEK